MPAKHKLVVFDAKAFDLETFSKDSKSKQFDIIFEACKLTKSTVALVQDAKMICCFIHDDLSAPNLARLADAGVQCILLRSAGYNHIDLKAAKQLNLRVARVPRYSAAAIAEYAVALILTLNRKIHRAYGRVREGDFSLHGLMGFDLYQKTIGVIGAGYIGSHFAKIMLGFGCQVFISDPDMNPELANQGALYVSLERLLKESDVISLHCPLNPKTAHLIDDKAIAQMKPGVMVVNTSRGAVIDTTAMISALKTNKVGALGLDVYEEEADLFYEDLSDQIIQDDVFARLLTFPNVIVTSHQAFFTREAVEHIVETCFDNALAYIHQPNVQNDAFLV